MRLANLAHMAHRTSLAHARASKLARNKTAGQASRRPSSISAAGGGGGAAGRRHHDRRKMCLKAPRGSGIVARRCAAAAHARASRSALRELSRRLRSKTCPGPASRWAACEAGSPQEQGRGIENGQGMEKSALKFT